MKRNLLALVVTVVISISSLGCAEKSTTSRETTVKTPGGTTTTTETQKIEKSGENPPPAVR
jgi:hypothetical protein